MYLCIKSHYCCLKIWLLWAHVLVRKKTLGCLSERNRNFKLILPFSMKNSALKVDKTAWGDDELSNFTPSHTWPKPQMGYPMEFRDHTLYFLRSIKVWTLHQNSLLWPSSLVSNRRWCPVEWLKNSQISTLPKKALAILFTYCKNA